MTSKANLPVECRRLIDEAARSASRDVLLSESHGIDATIKIMRDRAKWLRGFGALSMMWGLPGKDTQRLDLPVAAIDIERLVAAFEKSLPPEGAVEDSPAFRSYLLLKAAGSLGKHDAQKVVSSLCRRWIASVTPLVSDSPILVDEDVKVLVTWLRHWNQELPELAVLDGLESARFFLEPEDRDRLSTLREKLPQQRYWPIRQHAPQTLRVPTEVKPERLKQELEDDIKAGRELPVYLVRQLDRNTLQDSQLLPDTATHDDLIKSVHAHLASALANTTEQVVFQNMSKDSEEPRFWLALVPVRARENGLAGLSVWADIQVWEVDGMKRTESNIFFAIDPSGLEDVKFAEMTARINKPNTVSPLERLARDVNQQIREYVGRLFQPRSSTFRNGQKESV